MQTAIINTPIGLLELKGTSEGLVSVVFLNEEAVTSTTIPEVLVVAVTQLQEYFKRKRKDFTIPLSIAGTSFQQKVWNELCTIPYGKTASYLQIAKQIGDPKVIRAAASANGKNPISIIIPCHRIIGSDGSLTGYAGGLHRKKWLLEHESPYTQGTLF
ncbi:methylated-DNA--[protein]-cysteine S-methyltransferase [Dokdonia sp. Hel_I_53]|uniref:methylated-DNA--[protein]-cysteine S-methyltransferase n=1 Tax=Dokdonia sp. Hel_I_53 TaxID=1566287 RepID=UPI00119BFC9E|nr:methylated-DNA--[protein]-cysteine S-methyltransferase [Dokdonia sp. Hel_I_53]TVZ52563.1 methylated-DNA-[protein]-cysteine S-methyltransferase [Dokdonia sp. Hel_I_53]